MSRELDLSSMRTGLFIFDDKLAVLDVVTRDRRPGAKRNLEMIDAANVVVDCILHLKGLDQVVTRLFRMIEAWQVVVDRESLRELIAPFVSERETEAATDLRNDL